MKYCPQCQTALPSEARFCFQCGKPQEPAPAPKPKPEAVWKKDPVKFFLDRFIELLRAWIAEEHDQKVSESYSEQLYRSGFRETLQRRAEQFEQEVGSIESLKEIDLQVGELVDYFLIQHCQDLNRIDWSESILKYQGEKWETTDQFQMVLDFLDFANENETVYTDFLQMPTDMLRNAGRSFLFPEKQERILLICDQSILGSCKEGFALTEAGIYWKAHLAKPAKVLFRELTDIYREKEWIMVNGNFFNANPTLNIKMLRLLKTIQRMLSK